LTMKVVAANLDILSSANLYQRLHAVGDAAIAGLRGVFRRRGVTAVVQGFGPMFQIYFTKSDGIRDYRDYCKYADTKLYSRFVHLLLERGIYMTPSNGLHWIISTAHTEADIDMLVRAADQACVALSWRHQCCLAEAGLRARSWRDCGSQDTNLPSWCMIATRGS